MTKPKQKSLPEEVTVGQVILGVNEINLIETLINPTVVSEVATGIAQSLQDIPAIAGRVIQGGIKGNLRSQIGRELDQLREKGKIKEDYFASNDAMASINELLEFIDSVAPDKEKLKAVTSVFLSEISKDTLEGQRQLAHELFKIVLKLNSMEILILKTCYDTMNSVEEKNVYAGIRTHGEWVSIVTRKLGIKHEQLIVLEDDNLVNKGLLSPRTASDKSGIISGNNFRLTGLGIEMCDLMTRY